MWLELNNLLKTSVKSLFRNRARSFLTSLGIIIGVGAVVIMVGLGAGARENIEKSINSLGSNVIMVRPSRVRVSGVSKGAGSFNRLTLKDVEVIKKNSFLLKAVSPIVRASGQIIGNGKNWSSSVYGVNNDYLVIKDWDLERGTVFTDRESFSRKKVALLGKTVADELFPDNDPLGETIRVRNVPFKVIGVLSEKGQGAMGEDQDDIVLVPATTALYRVKGGNYIDMVFCSAEDRDLMTRAEEEVERILRTEHGIRDGEDNDFELRNQSEIIERASSMSRTMTMLLAAVAAVSLLVGGIGIMNIMLVSVTERTREIGTRMAVGARKSDILIQFLTESIILSAMGGLSGVLFAYGLSAFLSGFYGFTVIIEYWSVMTSLLFAGLVGVFFGIYPASKAAALNPIDALRYE